MMEQTKKYGPFFLVLAAATAASGAYLLYVVFYYQSLDGFLDHVETNIAIAGWRFLEGYPLYHQSDEWPIFATHYGPLVYLIQAAAFAVFGGAVEVSKLANSLAVAGAAILFFMHARRNYGLSPALSGLMLFAAFILVFAPHSIWNRPDPFTIFLVVLAVYANGYSRSDRPVMLLMIGACIGLAVNMKVHSFIYFFPVIFDGRGLRDFRALATMASTSFAVFLLPFLLPQVSLVNYVSGIFEQVSIKTMDFHLLVKTLRYSALYLSPGLVLSGLLLCRRERAERKDIIYFSVLVAGVMVSLYPAAFPGSGIHHLLPMFPIVIDSMLRFMRGFSDMPRTEKTLMLLIPVIFLAVSAPVQRRMMRNLDRMANETVAEELRAVVKSHPDESVEMGYGVSFETYRYTFYKPVLIFAGNHTTMDSQAIMEFHIIGKDVLGRLSADFSSCRTRHWLIPKDEPPFLMRNHYDNSYLFGEARQVFLDNYKKTAAYNYFDLWSCSK